MSSFDSILAKAKGNKKFMIMDDVNLGRRNELIRVRCPQCFKLYSIESAEINEAKPKFECLDCKQRFWLPYPEALEQASGLIGFPLEWIEENKQEVELAPEKVVNIEPEVEQKPFQCPKCEEPYAGGETQCGSCGIIFDKFEEVKEKRKEPPATRELKERWDRVVESYELFHVHEDFIAAAQMEQALTFALFKYKQILEVNPSDDFASQGKEMVSALMNARVESQTTVREEPKKFVMPKLRVGTFIILLCGIVMAMGIMIPGARNLVGVGSAVLFFVLALRYYFRVL